MSLSSALFSRSPALKDKVGAVQIPDFAVLFYYGQDIDWVATPSGTLNKDYYTSIINKSNYFKTLLTQGETPNPLISYPIFTSSSDYTVLGTASSYVQQSVDSSISQYGTQFDIGGSHNPTTVNFRSSPAPLAFASVTGDTLSTVKTDYYYKQNDPGLSAHEHYTLGDSLYASFVNRANDPINETYGIPQIAVNAVFKDPSLSSNPSVLGWLPANTIVFGADLPANNADGTEKYFTRNDTIYTGNKRFNYTFNGGAIDNNTYYITCYSKSAGSFFYANSNFTITTDSTGLHSHYKFTKPTSYQKSTKTGQKGSILTDGGLHSHNVIYNTSTYVRGKKLKAWITQSHKTPIANGVIIGYYPSAGLGYNIVDPNATVQSTLPAGWFVCDGTNGTPDLRNYYVGANFNDSDHDVDITNYTTVPYPTTSNTLINSITMQANGKHSHVTTSNYNVTGYTGTPVDIGSHAFENSTDHVHTIVNKDASPVFFPAGSKISLNKLNEGDPIPFIPSTLNIVYIMYNEGYLTGSYDVTVPPPDYAGAGGPS